MKGIGAAQASVPSLLLKALFIMLSIFKSIFGSFSRGCSDARATGTSEEMKKYLIVGLGNPGAEYARTRHNVGFMTVDKLAGEVPFTSCRYGDMAIVRVKNCELHLFKPSTFMNLSGVAVRYWMNRGKLPLENLMIVVDDIALPFGKLRMRGSGSDAGHNGLKNIASELGNTNYPRLRIGVGNEFARGAQIDYVLGEFPAGEQKVLPEVLERAAEAVKAYALSGLAFAMNHFNK